MDTVPHILVATLTLESQLDGNAIYEKSYYLELSVSLSPTSYDILHSRNCKGR